MIGSRSRLLEVICAAEPLFGNTSRTRAGKTLPELRLSGLAVQAHRHIGNLDLKVVNELEILP